MAWSTSDRASRLPRDWPKRVAHVRRRAGGRCEAVEHAPGCDGIGTDCDHIERGDDHALTNLQWLSAACHGAKTQGEAEAARQLMHAKLRRPALRHPGLTGPTGEGGEGESPLRGAS